MSINEYCGRFAFAWDMNGDLAFSVSDVWLLVKALWLLPSTAVASMLHLNSAAATFFEVDCQTGLGIGGAVFSALAWLVGLVAFGGFLDGVRRAGTTQ